MIFAALLLVPLIGYALLFSFLPARAVGVVLAVSLLLCGFLWTRPRYYLLEGGNNSVVINGEGRNWTITQPVYFGEISHLGKFAAWLLGVGGLIAYRVRQGRAARKLVAGQAFPLSGNSFPAGGKGS